MVYSSSSHGADLLRDGSHMVASSLLPACTSWKQSTGHFGAPGKEREYKVHDFGKADIAFLLPFHLPPLHLPVL